VPDSIDPDAPCDDEAPTRLRRLERVQLHPKFDPRRLPTQRRLAVVRALAAPAEDLELPPRSRRGGVKLAWVAAFIAVAYLSILVAVTLALR
jgi:hypothetical protein